MTTIPDSAEDRKAIHQALTQISEELSTIATCKTQINEILKSIEDKYKVPKKTMRKVANLHYRQTVVEFENEAAEIKQVYSAITGVYKTKTT